MELLKSKYSRTKPKPGGFGGRGRNAASLYRNDRKPSSSKNKKDLDSIINHMIESTGTSTSFYGVQTLQNAKRIFGEEHFNIYKHMKDLFHETSTGDVDDLLDYLLTAKQLTSNFLSKKVRNQYVEFIAMSRNVLEIEDQMSEMDDMLKSMSLSMKSLHETSFKMLDPLTNTLNSDGDIGSGITMDNEEERDRERREMEILESIHDQILQHIQLRELQAATDLIVTARNEHFHLKQSARKRAMQFINNHIHELEALIVDQLSSSSYLPDMKRDKLSTLLMKLGFVDEAMELFLSHKSKTLKQAIRQISLYGDVKQYIEDLSKVFFDFIINSTIQYTNLLSKIEIEIESARDDAMSLNPFDIEDEKEKKGDNEKQKHKEEIVANSQHFSRLVVWIYAELEGYEKLFEQQVFQLEQNDFRTIGECLKIVFKQSKRLDSSGIHVSFLLSNHFEQSIEAAINRLYKKKLEAIKKLKRKENYVSKSKTVSSPNHNSAADKKRMMHRLSIYNKKLQNKKRMSLLPVHNPFTQTTRRTSAARYSRISKQIENETKHQRRSSEIFGDVINVNLQHKKGIDDDDKGDDDGDGDDKDNIDELRRLTHHRRKSKLLVEQAMKQNTLTVASAVKQSVSSHSGEQYTVVKLTRSGQEMYEIVKKCIQETWRLLDQRYYGELTKSVYRTVVTQMIYLVQVFSSQITAEINEKAPKQLTSLRKRKGNTNNVHSKRKGDRKHKRNSKRTVPSTIMENKQYNDGDLDDEKACVIMENTNKQHVLNESQMLSLIANVYYVSEDLLRRIGHRYHKLFGRQIPELQLFVIEQQKLYNAQFQQFSKKFLFKWINDKLLWKNDKISPIYAQNEDISIVTSSEITSWSISKSMLNFVRYLVNLRLQIEKYLGSNCDQVILRDSIEILLNELLNGDYISDSNSNTLNGDEIVICITPHGLNKLYLDFRFFMVTLSNFITEKHKKLVNAICEKAKKYVNRHYNLSITVDWKLMHSLAMKLQYKVLSGDELDVLNKAHLTHAKYDKKTIQIGAGATHNK